MAIQKSITDTKGVTHTEAYVLIRSVFINTRIDNQIIAVAIQMQGYHNAAMRSKDNVANMKAPFMTDRAELTSADIQTYFADTVLAEVDKSPWKQAYAWLKTQDSLVDAGLHDIDWTTGTTDV